MFPAQNNGEIPSDLGSVPMEEDWAVAGAGSDADGSEAEHFDITLAARHSYMGSELEQVGGRNVLEAGWRGVVPCMLHGACVFPGETLPLLLRHRDNVAALASAVAKDRLFALLFPDESGETLSGYGALCEVTEAARQGEGEVEGEGVSASYKARAVYRCRAVAPRAAPLTPFALYDRLRPMEVEVLPELVPPDPLQPARLAALDSLRLHGTQRDRRVRALEALGTPWPLFVFDIFDFAKMRETVTDYFKEFKLDGLMPSEPVALSFWTARNLTLGGEDLLALFTVDNALLRLHMECDLISQSSTVCCGRCGASLAERRHVFAMSSDGLHSTYTNPGGYMHEIVTVSDAAHVRLSGEPSEEYSWFPGYSWTVALCSRCHTHVGWKFGSVRRALRPAEFFGLKRMYRASSPPRRARPLAYYPEAEERSPSPPPLPLRGP